MPCVVLGTHFFMRCRIYLLHIGLYQDVYSYVHIDIFSPWCQSVSQSEWQYSFWGKVPFPLFSLRFFLSHLHFPHSGAMGGFDFCKLPCEGSNGHYRTVHIFFSCLMAADFFPGAMGGK